MATVEQLRPLVLDSELNRLVSFGSPKPEAQFTYTEPSSCSFVFTDISMSTKPITKYLWTLYNNDTEAVLFTSSLQNPSTTISPCVNVRAELVVETEDTFNPSDPYVVLLVKQPIAVQGSPSISNAVVTLNGSSSYSFDSDLLVDDYRWSISESDTDYLVLGYIESGITLSVSGALAGGTSQSPQVNLKTLYNNSFTNDTQEVSIEYTAPSSGLQYTFLGGGSTDVTTYAWTIYDTDGTTILTTGTETNITYTFSTNGTYIVALQITSGSKQAITFETVTV